MFKKLHYFTIIMFSVLSLLTAEQSFAQRSSGGSGASKFSLGVMALAGKGTMGNGLSDAPDRDMMFFPVAFFAGYNIKKFRLGVNYEYMMGNQTTTPADVANTNVSGTGSSLGVRLEYYDGVQGIGAVYRASTSYNLEKQTVAGTSATYKGSSGFSIQYMRQIKNRFGFVIDYTSEEFSESLTTANIKWNRIGLGIVFANFTARGR